MEPVAETTKGAVRGREKSGVLLFGGIPFAASTAGANRFRPPQPVEAWTGEVRDATRFGKVAPQPAAALGGIVEAPPPDWSEDCLFLNVQTPTLDDARRPVMVWIHGGSFITGTGAIPWYDGADFVKHGDVVTVTINYRLGALGWLYLGDLDPSYQSSGNNGLLDQIAALEWVRDNITAFGGNPDDVTLYGESAGGMSVATLFGTPAARGLFHKAIPQSGAAHNVWGTDVAADVTTRMLAALDVSTLEELLALPAEKLLDAQTVVDTQVLSERVRGEGGAWGTTFAPIVDGVALSEPPLTAVKNGLSADVPLLIGTTKDEWNLFDLALPEPPDDDTIVRRLQNVVDDPVKMLAAYRQDRPDASPREIWATIMTDRVFRIPAIRLAEAQAQHQPDNTFMYVFDWPSTSFGGRLGACHSIEIPFVFDNLDKPGVEILTGAAPPQSVADAMHAAWLDFVHHATPASDLHPNWLPYDAAGSGTRSTMHFDVPCRVDEDPMADERRSWDGAI